MSYDAHMAQALRFAATALAHRPSADTDRRTLAVFHRDAALLLAETGAVATRIRLEGGYHKSVPELARHPVRTMLSHLASIAHPKVPIEAPAPSVRWAGRPASPADVADPVQAWKGVVVQLLLARHAVDAEARPLPRDRAWTVTADVAALAETLATSITDLLPPPEPHEARTHISARILATSLAVDAREVARLAAMGDSSTARPAPAPRDPRGTSVVTIPGSHRLPDAVARLTDLLHHEEPSAPDLLAVVRVLAQTSRAAATALTTAATVSGIPEHLNAAAAALDRHADHLAAAVTTHQTRLGSITPGAPLLIAQAREIGAIGVPGLRALAGRPDAAEAASPHLLRYAELMPGTTDTLAATFASLQVQGLVMIRDRSDDDAAFGWRRATADDLAALTRHLDDAAAAARTAPAPIRDTVTPTLPAEQVAASGAYIDLQEALRRRQESLRPARPFLPIQHGTPIPVFQRA